MDATNETPAAACSGAALNPGGPTDDRPEKDWEQFEACARCHGHAPIEESPDGDLYCEWCHARLPRPSS
jgi:hypothetical protein